MDGSANRLHHTHQPTNQSIKSIYIPTKDEWLLVAILKVKHCYLFLVRRGGSLDVEVIQTNCGVTDLGGGGVEHLIYRFSDTYLHLADDDMDFSRAHQMIVH